MVNLQFYLCSDMLLKLNWSLLTSLLCFYMKFAVVKDPGSLGVMYRNFSSSQDYHRSSLRLVDKITRCKHHIELISTYLREKKVRKGFRLKFHSGLDCPDYFSKTLSKASSKLMIKRRTFYRRELDSSVEAYNAIWSALEEDFPNYSKTLRDECDFKMGKLATLLSFRRLKNIPGTR